MAELVEAGDYSISGSVCPASNRNGGDPTYSGNVSIGFRPALFL